MSKNLNTAALAKAKELMKAGEYSSLDSSWYEEQPTPDEVTHFVETHYMSEYSKWFLGYDTQYPDTSTDHYKYPHGDLKIVQRCALESSLKQAEKDKNKDVVRAARELLDILDTKKK